MMNVLLYPTNYGFNFGTWFVCDPQRAREAMACFSDSFLSFRDCLDGAANTLLVSGLKRGRRTLGTVDRYH